MSKITFGSDGYTLAGNLFIPKNGAIVGAFLFIQGWTGHQNVIAAKAMAELGYTTMTYDMRGNGDSEGNIADFSRADFIKDAGAAYDFLRQQVDTTTPIGVVGSSFGSYTAVMLSSERDVSHLSLRVPANYPDEGYDRPQLAQITQDNKKWRKQKLNFKENRALAIIHEFKGKVQIIEAGADETVASQTPHNYAGAIVDSSLLTYEIVSDAPHRLADARLRQDYSSRLVDWVKNL
jgi:alpha/beta superfamily hydrolase